MKQNLERFPITPSVTLVDKEGLAVDYAGAVITAKNTGCLGVVSKGRPANVASELEIRGQTEIYVDGGGTAVGVSDPLVAGGGTIAGYFVKAVYGDTAGNDLVRAYAMEAATTSKKIKAFLI